MGSTVVSPSESEDRGGSRGGGDREAGGEVEEAKALGVNYELSREGTN